MIKAVINLEAPRAHAYSVLADFANYKQWLPGCVESKVTATSGSSVDMEITIQSMKTMTMGLRYELQPDQLLNYRMTKGKDLKAYSGSWRLMDSADGSGTVVMGEMEMDAGGVPAFMLARMAKKAVDAASEALKKRVRMVPLAQPKPGIAAAAPAKVAPRRRLKRVLHVMKVPGGYRVWMLGEAFFLQDRALR